MQQLLQLELIFNLFNVLDIRFNALKTCTLVLLWLLGFALARNLLFDLRTPDQCLFEQLGQYFIAVQPHYFKFLQVLFLRQILL